MLFSLGCIPIIKYPTRIKVIFVVCTSISIQTCNILPTIWTIIMADSREYLKFPDLLPVDHPRHCQLYTNGEYIKVLLVQAKRKKVYHFPKRKKE